MAGDAARLPEPGAGNTRGAPPADDPRGSPGSARYADPARGAATAALTADADCTG